MALNIARLDIGRGRVAFHLHRLLMEGPTYLLPPRSDQPPSAGELLIPGNGVIQGRLGSLVEQGLRRDACVITRVPQADGKRFHEMRFVPRRACGRPLRMAFRGTLYPTGDSLALRVLAQRWIEGDIAERQCSGVRVGQALLGPRARLEQGAIVHGAAAVGAESLVRAPAVLDHGAVVGRDCWVPGTSRLSHCVLLDGCRLAPDTILVDKLCLPSGRML